MLLLRVRQMGQAHWLALFGLILAGWAGLFVMAVPPADGYARALIDSLCGTDGTPAGPLSSIAMWALMSGAMMAPTALPAFVTYDDLGQSTKAPFAPLLAGYLTVWLGFSVLAGLAQVALVRAGLLDALGTSRAPLFSAFLLFMAGLYQFTPLKEACLSRCRAPLTFFMAHWQSGPWRMGLRLGSDCLGCCWALMALAWVGGMMNLGFMALAMIMMVLEKLPRIGQWLTRPLGVVLILWGLAVVII